MEETENRMKLSALHYTGVINRDFEWKTDRPCGHEEDMLSEDRMCHLPCLCYRKMHLVLLMLNQHTEHIAHMFF